VQVLSAVGDVEEELGERLDGCELLAQQETAEASPERTSARLARDDRGLAGGFSSTWPGILQELKRENETVNTGLILGLLLGGRGIGNAISGPISAALLEDANTYIYVCGVKGMEDGVMQALHDIAAKRGNAWEPLWQQFKAEGRFHVETY
jgi:hypothetical protein